MICRAVWRFKSARTREIGRGDDGVKVRIEDDPGVDFERFMLATVFERLDKDVAACRGSEDGKPRDRGAGNEVGEVAFEDAVAAAHGGHSAWRSAASKTSAFPSATWERGGPSSGKRIDRAIRLERSEFAHGDVTARTV